MVRLDHFYEEEDDARWGLELATFRAVGAGELSEGVFEDGADGVAVHGDEDLEAFEQFLEEGFGEEVVGLGPDDT